MVSRRLDYKIAGLLTGLLAGAFGEGMARAVPGTMTQQGLLLDQSNTPVSGTQTFVFAIYASATGGTALWTETQTITLDGGYFSTQLGSVTPIPTTVFGGATVYLGITIGSDAEMTPREAMTSVPYALVSNDARGDINPTSVTVNGLKVINAAGAWVGPTTGLAGSVGATGPAGATGATGPQGQQGLARLAPQGRRALQARRDRKARPVALERRGRRGRRVRRGRPARRAGRGRSVRRARRERLEALAPRGRPGRRGAPVRLVLVAQRALMEPRAPLDPRAESGRPAHRG